MKFFIIATGFNCKGYDRKCIQSVLNQTYQNFTAVFISDGSTDGTLGIDSIKGIHDDRLICVIEKTNMGAAKRRYDYINLFCKDEEAVVLLLGLDDELLPNCLETIKEQYDKGMWMTYGNWINQHGKKLPPGFLFFDAATHRNRDYRKVKYRSTAPNTFKKFLFDQIPAEDFQLNGKWIDSTTESELMFSCLEMCGRDRIGVIEEPIYLYNEALPNGTLKRLGVAYKYDIYNHIINRPKKPLYDRSK